MNVSFFEPLLSSLDNHLNPNARREIQALKKIFVLFPGQDFVSIEKSIEDLLKSSQNSLPKLKERAKSILAGELDSIEDFLKDLSSFSSTNLKNFGKEFEVDLLGTKKENMDTLRDWLISRGEKKPPTKLQKAENAALVYVGNLPDLMKKIDDKNADQILEKIGVAYVGLDKDGFKVFGELIGVSVSGTKAKMKKQLEDFVNRAAISHTQTQF